MPTKTSGAALALLEEQIPSKIFTRFVQAGRLVFIQFGKDAGKVAIISDIIDQCRLLVDGPTTGVPRQSMPIKRIKLTDFVFADFERGASSKQIEDMLKKEDLVAKWNASSEGVVHNAALARANLTDFERYKVRAIRKQRAYEINKLLAKDGVKRTDFGLRASLRKRKHTQKLCAQRLPTKKTEQRRAAALKAKSTGKRGARNQVAAAS